MVFQRAASIVHQQIGLCKAISFVHSPVYTAVCPVAKASIGGHIRHSTDHFTHWVQAAQKGLNVIDYDNRIRGSAVENNIEVATQALEELHDRLLHFDSQENTLMDMQKRVVKAKFMIDAQGTSQEFESTLLRELWFVTHHAIHHNASIKNIIDANWVTAGEVGDAIHLALLKSIPEDFALAPSTANHKVHLQN